MNKEKDIESLLGLKSESDQLAALTDGESSICWRDVDAIIASYLDELAAIGPTGTVVLLAHNQVRYPLAVLAAIYAGWTVVPVNNRLTDAELRYIVDDAAADLLWLDAHFQDTGKRLAGSRLWLSLDAECGQGDSDSGRRRLRARLNKPAGHIMLYTSGTTGRPKGVLRKHSGDVASLFTRWRDMAEALSLDAPGPHLVTGPLYHAAPLLFALFAFTAGNPLLIMQRFDAEVCLQWMQQHQVAHGHWVPTMFVRMLALRGRYPRAPDALVQALHGAAPISPAVKKEMIDWWGPLLSEYWGGSESGTVTRCSSEEWLARPGTVGRPVPGFDVSAIDEMGKPLPAGEVGRLVIRHSSGEPIFHYHRDAEKTRRAYIDQAGFMLGDIGYVDADGWVFLKDRDSRIVISGGVNLYPAEVESVLIALPEVLDVAAIGVADAEWGQTMAAVVELAEPVDEQAALARIQEELKLQLAGYKHPKLWRFQPLNRPDNGKLNLADLRKVFE